MLNELCYICFHHTLGFAKPARPQWCHPEYLPSSLRALFALNLAHLVFRMGSYLSIHNNTDDTWQVKVGSDEAAISISGVVSVTVTVIAAVIGTAGAAAPLTTYLAANGVVSICGLSASALAAVCSAAAAVSEVAIAATATGWAKAMVVLIHQHFKKEGYHTLAPGKAFSGSEQDSITNFDALLGHAAGQTIRYKKTLSLWQQGTCIRARQNPDNKQEIIIDTLYMRPIFSGATAESNNTHRIQWWINKWGTKERQVLALGAS